MLRHLAMVSLILIWPTFPASILNAEDWPRFRGPNGTGVSSSQGLPTQFGPETNVIWKIDSGGGSSSPVIAAGRLYFTSFDGGSRTVHCQDARTGKDLWKYSFQKNRVENATRPNGPATCTAAADGTCVVFFLPDTGLYCFEASSTSRWDTEVGPFYSMHGIAGSPVIAGGKVLILADQLAGSHLAAYDLATGRLAWKVERSDGLTGGYSTPSVMKSGDGSTCLTSPSTMSWYLICVLPASSPEAVAKVIVITGPFSAKVV